MEVDRSDPSRWHALAAEARMVAEKMTEPEARRSMLEIAERYARLAALAERRKARK